MTSAEIKNVSSSPGIVTLEDVAGLDFKTPFDELSELRAALTTQEIAEFTGLRRETISRARPDIRLQRRTEKAIGDLYLVVTRMQSIAGKGHVHLAAILRRPQVVLGDHSIAELLKEGRVDLVLEHLAEPEPEPESTPAPDVEPRLRPWKPPTPARSQAYHEREEARVAAFLAADPELAARLPEIEARLREHFAPVERIDRSIGEEIEGEGDDVLYLEARNGLSFDENSKRLMAMLERERDILDPVADQLTIAFL